MRILRNNWPYLVLIVIMALGAFLRLWNLEGAPPGIYPDEAKNANDAITTLRHFDFRIFYTENNGREGLYIWLIALSFKLFGINIAAFKLVSALAGTFTILATYLVTKELMLFSNKDGGRHAKVRFSYFSREVAALLAAGFLATSFWHINFSRIGFRAILVPLILSFALYFTLRALRERGVGTIIISGVLWGLAYYTYIAARLSLVIPLFLVAATFVFYLVDNRPRLSFHWLRGMYANDGWWRFGLWGLVAALTLWPLIFYFLNNPGALVARSSGISVFDAANPALALLKSLGLHLQMFFIYGDNNWRHNFAEEPQIMAPVALLFLGGIFYSLWAVLDGFRTRVWSRVTVQAVLWLWFFALLAPAVLTTEGIPHSLRAIGVMPVVFIFAAFGFLLVIRLLFPHRHHQSDIWPFGLGAALVIILLSASFQFSHYFIDWGQRTEVEDAFSKNYVSIGSYFNELPEDVHKYLIVNTGGVDVSYPREIMPVTNTSQTLPMPAQTTLFIQQTHSIPIKNTTYLTPEELKKAAIVGQNVFVPLEANSEIKQLLKMRYPSGNEQQLEGFWAYAVIF